MSVGLLGPFPPVGTGALVIRPIGTPTATITWTILLWL